MFRFVSILGERYTHGHVIDFFRALRADPTTAARARRRPPAQELPVRAGLRERDADRAGAPTSPGFAVYNLGTDESIVVDESIGVITEYLGVQPVLEHTGGERGWAGDSPLIHLDTAKIRVARLGAVGDDPRIRGQDPGVARWP